MNAKRVTAAVAGALVAGLVLGSVASSFAATKPSTSSTSSVAAACAGAGLRLGATMRESGGRLLDVVAKLTGQSTAAVIAERQAGKTFTQIAADKNVSSSAVVAEALKVRQALLAEKVADGTITQAQADTMLANMKTRLTERVESVNTACDGNGGGMRGRGNGGGRGAGCGGACAASAQ